MGSNTELIAYFEGMRKRRGMYLPTAPGQFLLLAMQIDGMAVIAPDRFVGFREWVHAQIGHPTSHLVW